MEVADALEQDEREIVSYLDEETQAIAHLPSLFTKNELGASVSSDDIFLRVKQELQVRSINILSIYIGLIMVFS